MTSEGGDLRNGDRAIGRGKAGDGRAKNSARRGHCSLRWLSAPVLSRGVRVVSHGVPETNAVPVRDNFEIYRSHATAQNRRGYTIKLIKSSARRVFRPTFAYSPSRPIAVSPIRPFGASYAAPAI
jgi:hypothetical protein